MINFIWGKKKLLKEFEQWLLIWLTIRGWRSGKNSEEKWFWKLSNKDFAQWVLDVSDDLKLYTTNERNQRKYYPYYFANLFLTKKGIKFKSEDLRHNMSAINTSINGKEVRNIKPLIAVRGIARREIKAKSL